MSDRQTAQLVAPSVTGSVQVKVGVGRCVMVSNNTTAAVTIHDVAVIGDVGAGNLIASIPNVIGVYFVDMPFYKGLGVVAGAGNASIGYT